MTESEVASLGVPVLDSYLGQVAREHNKTVQAVETAREQCEAFNSVPDSLAIQLLNGSLNYYEKLRNGSDLAKFYEPERSTKPRVEAFRKSGGLFCLDWQ